jgi:SOS response regulatory protein OraA/RecX
MAKITALEPDPRRPGAVRVLVDGKLFCTVHEAGVAAGELAVGTEWNDHRAESAGRAADEEAAWRALLRALERRSHATAQLRRRLVQKGHPPEAVDYAIARAQEVGLLDDAAFARHFVESRSARGRGPARLRRDHATLGVARAHIDAALSAQWTEPESALALADDLARRRARQLRGLPRDTCRRRLLAYLGRRGFTGRRVSELVTRVLRES